MVVGGCQCLELCFGKVGFYYVARERVASYSLGEILVLREGGEIYEYGDFMRFCIARYSGILV